MGKTSIVENSSGDHSCVDDHTEPIWIFGYGSILWQTGFTYKVKKIGHIKGFDRVFWQGNITHRGVPGKPGRVATLVPNPQGEVWGAAYQLVDPQMIKDAMAHLHSRECTLGGYQTTKATFYPRDCVCGHTITVLVFLASPENDFWLGPSSIAGMVPQILDCSGPNGTNAEYVLLLAWCIRTYIPESVGKDGHLFEFENALLDEIHDREKTVEDFTRSHLKRNDLLFDPCKLCDHMSFNETGGAVNGSSLLQTA